MVQLIDSDIKTREVLGWKGVHVLHYSGSSCSQKLRIFLNLKGIAWESHLVDLRSNENFGPWFLGINPRGLVPVLVHDGIVHIESNDIITYLERAFPTPKLIPPEFENEVSALLEHEDDLHLDLRTLSFRFVFAPPGPPKPAEALKSYAANGSGTVQGAKDRGKAMQIEFWERAARKVSPIRRRGPRRKNSARNSMRSIGVSPERPLSARRCAERSRYRLVHLCQPACACRLSDRAAASEGRDLARQARCACGIRQGGCGAAGGRRAHRGDTTCPRPSRQIAGDGCGLLTQIAIGFRHGRRMGRAERDPSLFVAAIAR